MKMNLALIAFVLAFSSAALSLTGVPRRSNPGPQLNCVTCSATDGTFRWNSSSANKDKAHEYSLGQCRRTTELGAGNCRKDRCNPFQKSASYGNCEYASQQDPRAWAHEPDPAPQEPSLPTPTPDNSCRSSASCGTFQVCVRGECVSDSSFDNRCDSDFDCGFGSTCSHGRCGN